MFYNWPNLAQKTKCILELCTKVWNICNGINGTICWQNYIEWHMENGRSKFLTSKKLFKALDLNFWVVFSLTTRQAIPKI